MKGEKKKDATKIETVKIPRQPKYKRTQNKTYGSKNVHHKANERAAADVLAENLAGVKEAVK